MATSQILNVGIGLLVLSLLLLAAFLQGSHATKSSQLMPSMNSLEGVLTSSLSTTIHASPDEVFKTLINYKDYSWSSNTKYAWDDEVPGVGSIGSITLQVEDLMTKTVAVTLTQLDHKTRTVVEYTTEYPRWLLKTRRVMQVVPVKGREKLCEFKASITHDGIAAYYLLLVAKGELADMLRRFAEDLKAFVEA